MFRRAVPAVVVAFALACSADAAAECVRSFDPMTPAIGEGAPPETETAAGVTRRDRIGRIVAPVTINGQGPFRFIVDTGANRSVVSQAVVDALGLQDAGADEVHTVHGVTPARLVEVESLRYGNLDLPSAPMPVLDGRMLAGEQGLLGVDGMVGRRLRLDFERRCIEIAPSNRAPRLRGNWVTLRGELRFGHLVVVQGRIRNVDVNVLIDTGSNSSLANRALHEALRARARALPQAVDEVRAYTAGEPIVLDTAIAIPRLTMSDVWVDNILVFVGDFHVFALWGLQDRPTLLVGMDVLAHLPGMAIDYQRATVHFEMERVAPTGSRIRNRLPH